MKAIVALLLVFAAAFAQAQLQYEQAAYTDAAAPAPEDMQPMEAESSFAEVEDAAAPGVFSAAAHKQQAAVQSVRSLFNKRKNNGGNIAPSKLQRKGWRTSAPRRPRPSVSGKKLLVKRAPAKGKGKSSSGKSLKAAIIDAKAGSSKKSKSSKKKAAAKKAKKAAAKLAKLLGSRGGKKIRRNKKGGKKLRIPKAPAAARGFVDNLWHSERHIPKAEAMQDPEMGKLNLALEAVKEDILSTNKQINDERRWVIAVSKIIKSYNTKMQRVEAHIIALRKEMKMLYRKKKQIENLKLQRALEAKLREAKAELKTLTDSLKHVARKQGELNKSGRALRSTIAGIQGQLAKLRGQRMFKKCKPGFKYNKKAKKCRSICRKGSKFNRKTKKCVSRCGKGKKYNKKTRKCVAKKGKGKGKGKKARRSRK